MQLALHTRKFLMRYLIELLPYDSHTAQRPRCKAEMGEQPCVLRMEHGHWRHRGTNPDRRCQEQRRTRIR